ncbi:NF-X1 finger and helicase domain protein [Aspergillus costaricaensis CBS 115574]|uniref:NF-X1 finger and helicase domain protein n=1 Tax=Aspergillus costaricaensis CBS 115574 TaxID=1448317 RepID=A0ACD1I2J2_9EURO|nr:NF-X1 finger and helicase domain protein [Aspergillus costaricaensis CBS 115574]RAK84441.1 NF-X1 finger and helicase domain protein [Aspergillus costaricaensis CBS 115574]
MANQKICRDFARDGKCKFRRCKFSHDTSRDNNRNAPRLNTKRPEPPASESDFRAWRRNLWDPNRDYPLGHRLGSFLREAQRLIDQDVGVQQEVIRALAEEGGLKRMKELIDDNILAARSSTQKSVILDQQVVPFLNIVTHPGVRNSLVLEQAVGTIYAFLYGLAGRRALDLLGFLADMLPYNKDQVTENQTNRLEMSLLTFWHILELNSEAYVHEGLKLLANRFQSIVKDHEVSQAQGALYNVRVYLQRILHRLSIGAALPSIASSGQPTPESDKLPSSFIIHRTPPGGRHNNDSADICDIQILPTSEEILSPHTEYLPVKDPRQWHISGVAGLLDRNFRLLREDTVGQLRDVIHHQLRPENTAHTRQGNQVRTYAYLNVKVASLSFDRHAGLQFTIRFRQLAQVQGLRDKQREEWWSQSRRLQSGALVCLIDKSGGDVLFCTVAEPPRLPPGTPQPRDSPSLWKEKDVSTVALEFVDPTNHHVQFVLDRYRPRGAVSPVTLVEFPGILLPAFAPTLHALQKMKRSEDLPFANLLAPASSENPDQVAEVPPPAYALKPGFKFDLSCLMTDETELHLRPGQAFDLEKFQQKSILDPAQAVGLINTLQHQVGLIQGPPGTGKSYTGVALIKVLLANAAKAKANIGPIICVCYTNHALDQLLEELLEKKITTQIVRIGSRCKSERVEKYTLSKLADRPPQTKVEKSSMYHLYVQLEECVKEFDALRLYSEGSEANLKRFLERHNPSHYRQLFSNDEEGWITATSKKGNNAFRQWINRGIKSTEKPRSIGILENIKLEQMSVKERQMIYEHWLTENRRQKHDKAKNLVHEQKRSKEKLNDVRHEVDLRCLRQAQVIGVTTSGLARNLKMLRRLQSKVVLCEEAGEVLEAHLLTALLPSVEHAILIGDHQQLRPQIQDYNLSRENYRGGEQYSLDQSLFERLVEPGEDGPGVRMPFSTLETQRRMHPSIAQLVRDTLYPRLEDSPSVLEYPEVCGMRQRLFWFDHQHLEADNSSTDAVNTSHWNAFEVEMTTALVAHLIRQGCYRAGEIAVLTPYLGQLHRLRRRLSESFSIVLGDRDQDDLEAAGLNESDAGNTPVSRSNALQTVRAATIDNFQGEEAKVVVISLVRSNAQRRCGFLRTSNRINVLLSRAKHGMYIIGNAATSMDVPMWRQVVGILKDKDNFGAQLKLQCPRHPESPIAVSEPDHFVQFSPEGGCNQRCANRLRCGHACKQKCHSTLLHDAVYCQEPCPRPLKGCDHACPKHCGDKCPQQCQVIVFDANRKLRCGHAAVELPCWQAQDPTQVKCPVPVVKQCVEPFWPADILADANAVSVLGMMGTTMLKSTMADANSRVVAITRRVHIAVLGSATSRSPVLRVRPVAMFIVAIPSAPTSAVSPAFPAPRLNAHRRVLTVHICAAPEVKDRVVDFILGEAYREIDLNENPCIFPRCGHFLTMESMDGQMDMKGHYELDADGKPVAITESSRPFSVEDVKRCATCRGSLRDISRYGRLVRRAMLDEATKKFILYLNNEYVPMAQELPKLVTALPEAKNLAGSLAMFQIGEAIRVDGSGNQQIKRLGDLMKKNKMNRWDGLLQLRKRMVKYYSRVQVEEQPFSRVQYLVEHARRQKESQGTFKFNESVLQTKGVLLARALLIRLDIALLGDFLSLYNVATPLSTRRELLVDLQKNMDDCHSLIQLAGDLHRVAHQAEGYIFLAQLCALQRSHIKDIADAERRLTEGCEALDAAEQLCRQYPGQTQGFSEEIESAKAMLRGSTFYSAVSNEERMAVITAMNREFMGIGHWYYCPNGHPFTIGECGGAMQVSTCPECGAPVGGQGHQTVDGVMRANDLEAGLASLSLE